MKTDNILVTTMNKTIEIDAQELFNPKVVRVSLVNRGANRSPIRKLKSEDGMKQLKKQSLNLSNIQSLLVMKAEEPVVADAPVMVAAITTLKGDDLTSLKDYLAVEGVVCVKSHESAESSTLIFDADADFSDVTKYSTIAISEGVAVVVKGFSSWSLTSDPTSSFAEAMQANGYFSNVYRATDMLMTRLEEVGYDALTKSEFAASVLPLVEDFSAYVRDVTSALPEAAFKMAIKVADLTPEEVEPVVVEPVVEDAVEPVVAPAVEPEVVTEPEVEPVTEPVAEPEVVAEVPVEDLPVVTEEPEVVAVVAEAEPVAKTEDANLNTILEAINAFKSEQSEKFEKLEGRLGTTEAALKITQKSTRGAVAHAQPLVAKTVEKAAVYEAPIDTGFGKF